MQPRRAQLQTLMIFALVLLMSAWPCALGAAEEAKKPPQKKEQAKSDDIWAEEGPMGERGSPRFERGPEGMDRPMEPRGEGRPPWFDQDPNAMINRIMEEVKKSDPAKAKELEQLRKKDPEKFADQIRELGREYMARVSRERWDDFRRRLQNEFVEWLQEHYKSEAEELTKVREKDPELYVKKFEIIWHKYRPIYDGWRRNPELGKVLIEDFDLREKRDELLRKIKDEKNEAKRAQLIESLQNIADRRFDLIVRRKEIAYEELLKRLEGLQKEVKKSRDDLTKAKDKKYKEDNVKKHVKDLLEGKPEFRWD